MWATSLVCVVALSLVPGQTGGNLKLTNDRMIYWYMGAPRPDSKVLPGDIIYTSFDIEGITINSTGQVLYSMAVEITDAKNKVWFKHDPRNLEAFIPLGGTSLPASAHAFARLDQPPGAYILKVTVTDRGAKPAAIQVLEKKFEIMAPGFGVVQVKTSLDPRGEILVPATGIVGQFYFVNFTVVGFERDKNKKQPDIAVEMTVLDGAGKQTFDKPFTGSVNKDVPENYKHWPMQFDLPLNRPGKFTIRLKATDNITKKSAEVSFPITVLPSQ